MSEEPTTESPRWHAYLLLAFIVAGFLSLAVRSEQSRICEEENGVYYVVAQCEHRFLLAKLFYPSECSFSYRRDRDGPRAHSYPEPAKYVDGAYEFAAGSFFGWTGDDLWVNENATPFFVRVDFEHYTIDIRGPITGRFVQCRQGDY